MKKVKEFLIERSGELCDIFCIISFFLIILGYYYNLINIENIIYLICFFVAVSCQIIFFIIERRKNKERCINIFKISIPLDVIIITFTSIVVVVFYYLFIK